MKPAILNNGKKVIAPFKQMLDNFWGTDNFFDDNFSQFRHLWSPAVNIRDLKSEFDIEIAVPGLTKDDFTVAVDNGMLTISAEKESKVEEEEEGFMRHEFNFNSFERSFTLPENVDADSIKAAYNKGILKLTLKKTVVTEPAVKKIDIH